MTSIDIVAMPIAERLMLMETLWDSLCAQSDTLESPAWHREVLEERMQRLAGGEEATASWSDAKTRIRAQAASS